MCQQNEGVCENQLMVWSKRRHGRRMIVAARGEDIACAYNTIKLVARYKIKSTKRVR